MRRNNQYKKSKAGWTIFDLLVFIAAAVPAGLISKYLGEKKPGLIFFILYVPLGFLFWGLVFVWGPRAIHRIRHGKGTPHFENGKNEKG